jgi:hypothetical protein
VRRVELCLTRASGSRYGTPPRDVAGDLEGRNLTHSVSELKGISPDIDLFSDCLLLSCHASQG